MALKQIDVEMATIVLEDVWAMEDIFGKRAHEEGEDAFQLEIENNEPESISLSFTRGDDERNLIIEQQGDQIVMYFYSNDERVEERLLLGEDNVVLDKECEIHYGP